MTVTGLARAIVSVADLDAALRFYRDVLGLPVVAPAPDVAMLALPGGTDLMLHQRPSRPSDAGVALSFAVDDVDATVDAAVSAGCGVLDAPADQPWGERQAVLTDPDGHVVCVVARP
ncbi:VOC family protein [Pseudonocardia benzenivorans]|jgi:catechol 2,3-dioxygenase-like lactoylglutathione lyase family enzyme|uniref:Glyoxalase/bleomycin resistance protein/dioxygenase n=2 Tax=Pseudonocardia TaxID=1847 RepID=F4CNJ4_PSEUX|nr:VOC family protein [Pseudonocardia dioxanivorans]AEA28292.1 Glyoxalase/bleomycin resistance protein/dioxygenase [Pseudonocardia dioxanivorans CB1190]